MILKLKKNGYLLMEALLSILITTTITFVSMMYLQVGLKLVNLKDDSQLQFAILQIRQELSLCESIEVQENSIIYVLNHEERSLKEDKDRLVKTPGYEILMEGVKNIQFYEKEDAVYVQVEEKAYQLY